MKFNRKDGHLELFVEGSIGEKNDLYDMQTKDCKLVTIDLSAVNMINSIGIKNWIMWIGKIPKGAQIILRNCPYVVANQVNMVKGFLPPTAVLQSMNTYYSCPDCGKEKTVLLTMGKDYAYGTKDVKATVNYPQDVKCDKCSAVMEPDFIPAKLFKFLEPQGST